MWDSQTWLGVGGIIGFSTPEDSSSVEAKGITITLSGLDATLLPEALTDVKLGLPVTIYLGLYDATNRKCGFVHCHFGKTGVRCDCAGTPEDTARRLRAPHGVRSGLFNDAIVLEIE